MTVNKVKGAMTFAELSTAVERFYARGATLLALWDFTEASLAQLSSGDVREYVRMGQNRTERRGGKTAIVASSDLEFALGRMAGIYADLDGLPFEIAVFRSMPEALAWLGVGEISAQRRTGRAKPV